VIDFRSGHEPKSSSFDYIQIRIARRGDPGPRLQGARAPGARGGGGASAAQWVVGRSHEARDINYRSFKPERDGLFCERIFGPVKDGSATAANTSGSAIAA